MSRRWQDGGEAEERGVTLKRKRRKKMKERNEYEKERRGDRGIKRGVDGKTGVLTPPLVSVR